MHLQLLIHLVKNPNDSEESKTEQTHRKVELITIDQFSYLRTIYQKVYNFCILATILQGTRIAVMYMRTSGWLLTSSSDSQIAQWLTFVVRLVAMHVIYSSDFRCSIWQHLTASSQTHCCTTNLPFTEPFLLFMMSSECDAKIHHIITTPMPLR